MVKHSLLGWWGGSCPSSKKKTVFFGTSFGGYPGEKMPHKQTISTDYEHLIHLITKGAGAIFFIERSMVPFFSNSLYLLNKNSPSSTLTFTTFWEKTSLWTTSFLVFLFLHFPCFFFGWSQNSRPKFFCSENQPIGSNGGLFHSREACKASVKRFNVPAQTIPRPKQPMGEFTENPKRWWQKKGPVLGWQEEFFGWNGKFLLGTNSYRCDNSPKEFQCWRKKCCFLRHIWDHLSHLHVSCMT